MFPNVVERLRGTPGRLEERLRDIPMAAVIRRKDAYGGNSPCQRDNENPSLPRPAFARTATRPGCCRRRTARLFLAQSGIGVSRIPAGSSWPVLAHSLRERKGERGG